MQDCKLLKRVFTSRLKDHFRGGGLSPLPLKLGGSSPPCPRGSYGHELFVCFRLFALFWIVAEDRFTEKNPKKVHAAIPKYV